MLLQTNSYIVPKERRAEHARLLRRFRQVLMRLGCDLFEVYEQMGPNWSTGDSSGRFVQIMRFRDRKHQREVHAAEQNDPAAQQLIAEFCDLVNLPYQQQQGMLAIGYYQGVMDVPASAITRQSQAASVARKKGSEPSQAAFGFGAPPAAAIGMTAGTAIGFGAAAFDAETETEPEDDAEDVAEESGEEADDPHEAFATGDAEQDEESAELDSTELDEAAYASALDDAAETLDAAERGYVPAEESAEVEADSDEAGAGDDGLLSGDDETALEDDEFSYESLQPAEPQPDEDEVNEQVPETVVGEVPPTLVQSVLDEQSSDDAGLDFGNPPTDHDDPAAESHADAGILTAALATSVPDARDDQLPRNAASDTTLAEQLPVQDWSLVGGEGDIGDDLDSPLSGEAELDPAIENPGILKASPEEDSGTQGNEAAAAVFGLDDEPPAGEPAKDALNSSAEPMPADWAGDDLPMHLATDEGEIEILFEAIPELVPVSARPEVQEHADGQDEIEAALNEALRD